MGRNRRKQEEEEEEEYEEEEEQEEEEDEEGEEEEEEEEGDEEEEEEEEEEEDEWAYSHCSGTKKALFIGINYFGTPGELRGCINDVTNMAQFIIENHEYPEENVRILRDDSEDPDYQPTKANILAGLEWLVEDAQTDDALFLHFSGHGSQQEDLDGDEVDGTDEALCPVDFIESGLIIDDTLNDILVKPLPVGCRLTVLFDSCHSGSALDLPYMYDADGAVVQDKHAISAASAAAVMAAVDAHNSGDLDALAKSAAKMTLVTSGGAAAAHHKTKREKGSRADVIYLSGCKDNQTSADAIEDGEATGAISFAVRKCLTEKSTWTYHELLVAVRTILQERYTQVPQLSSSHPIDTSLDFII